MKKITNDSIYKTRMIDELVKNLRIFGAICIEGPKWCEKTWMSSHHANSEFLIGDLKNSYKR